MEGMNSVQSASSSALPAISSPGKEGKNVQQPISKTSSAVNYQSIDLAYLSELGPKIDQAAGAQPVGSVEAEAEATKQYLIMLGAIGAKKPTRFLRAQERAFKFDDYGRCIFDKCPADGSGGWPKGKTFEDLLNDDRTKSLKPPKYVTDKLLAQFNYVRLRENYKNQFYYFIDVYDAFAKVFRAYDAAIKIDYLFERLPALNSKLPREKQISVPNLKPDSLNPNDLYSAMKALDEKKDLTPVEREIVDEMIVVCTLIMAKYCRAARTVQNANGIDDYGKGWPKNRTFEQLVNDQVEKNKINNDAGVDRRIADNILNFYRSDLTPNAFYCFIDTYEYYATVYSKFFGMIKFDPYEKMKAINEKDLICESIKLSTVTAAENFVDATFLEEVNTKLIPEAFQKCVSEKAFELETSWPAVKARQSNYIARVYKSLGTDLDTVMGNDGRKGRDILNDLLDRGYGGDKTGITAGDVENLTRLVEKVRGAGTEFTHEAYVKKGKAIQKDPKSVPASLNIIKKTDGTVIRFDDTPIVKKLNAAGISVPGSSIPRGIKQ